MPIEIALRKADRTIVQWGSIIYRPVNTANVMDDCPLLSGVDQNGNTVFNARQMVSLIQEAESLIAAIHESGAVGPDQDLMIASLREIISLSEAGQRPPHRFLWFHGD